MTALRRGEGTRVLRMVALTLAIACPTFAQNPGNDPCAGHLNTLQKWKILVGEKIFVEATFRVGGKTRTIYPDKSPYDYGSVIGSAKIHFRVVARDLDDHMCDIPQSPVRNLISETSLSVTIHTNVTTAPIAPPVDLKTWTAKTGERVWAGDWSVPPNLIGKVLVFVYRGTIDDVPCPSHPDSGDTAVELTTTELMTAVKINGDCMADPPPKGDFRFTEPTTIMQKQQKKTSLYCSIPKGSSRVEVTSLEDKDTVGGSLKDDTFNEEKAVTWNGSNSNFDPPFGKQTKWIGPGQDKASADVVMLLDDDAKYAQDGGPTPVATKKVDIIRLEFIRQNNSVIPFSGDHACHMVSKYRTNDNLPDKANFIGPPGSNPDPDTFRVQITGLFEGESPRVRLDISAVTPYSTVFPTVDGKQDGVAKYRTDEHVRLVSNPKDDEFLQLQPPLVMLGDIVKATLILAGADICDLSLPVARPPEEDGPKAIRTANIHFSTLEGVKSAPATTIARMTEDWAQVAMRFNLVAAATVKPVSNVLYVETETAKADGQLSVDIIRPGSPPVTVVSPIKKWNVAQQIALGLAAAISAKPGLTATAYPNLSQWLVVVNKGSDVDFANLSCSVPTVTFDEVPMDLNDDVTDLEGSVLGLNFMDNDDKTIEVIAVKNVLIDKGAAAAGGDWCALHRPGWRNVMIVPEAAVDADDAGYPFVASHEMGHVLFDGNWNGQIHSDDQFNLLFKGWTSAADSWSATKRLTDEQNVDARADSGPATTPPLLQKK